MILQALEGVERGGFRIWGSSGKLGFEAQGGEGL